MNFLKPYVTNNRITLLLFVFLLFISPVDGRQVEVTTYDYAVKKGETLIMDVYKSVGATGEQPVFVFLHGGGFSGGSPKHPAIVKMGEIVAEKGYTAIMISYRLTRKGGSFGCSFSAAGKIETFKFASEDFYDALQYISDNQSELKVDFSSLYVGGSSAGAEAVLSAVFNADLIFSEDKNYPRFKYSGVLSLAGAMLDARYITKNESIPTVFFHGIDDKLVPFGTAPHHFCEPELPGYLMLDGSATIANRLNEIDTSYLLYSFKNSGHEKSGIPLEYMDEIFDFFEATKSKERLIQQTIKQ